MMKAIFTDEELEYIYNYLDLETNPELVRDIEIKIRKQVKNILKMISNKIKK